MAAAPARIGPNAILQTVNALHAHYGAAQTQALIAASSTPTLLENLPEHMVDERLFHTLVHDLIAQLGPDATGTLLDDAGQRTAAYLLVHRIPRPFQAVVRPVPARAGLWLLLMAIRQHAWTFVGSGTFGFRCLRLGQPPVLTLGLPPYAAPPVSHFYTGTFTHLFRVLVAPAACVSLHLTATAHGPQCTYTVRLSPGHDPQTPVDYARS